jgi:hypothetical protein
MRDISDIAHVTPLSENYSVQLNQHGDSQVMFNLQQPFKDKAYILYKDSVRTAL